MKVGDKLRCTHSADNDFTVGKDYEIVGFDDVGDPIVADNDGFTGEIGVVLEGNVWRFEPVSED